MDFLIQLLDATLRVSVPLILAAMAGLYSERSGVIDIGLEGKMLAAAFAAAAVGLVTGSAVAGLSAALGVSAALALLHGLASVTYRGDQLISGMAVNIIVSGLTQVLCLAWFKQGGQTPALPEAARFLDITLPGAEALRSVPVIGTLYSDILSGHSALLYLTYALIPVLWFILQKTRFGLRVRAVGENPAAVDTAGVSVNGLRYGAVMMAGLLCGLAGAYMSLVQTNMFVRDMTAGKGFIALAAMIFGKWKPLPAVWACLIFGFLDALAIRLQGRQLPYIGEAPVQFIQALPYVLTVVLLAGFFGRARAPKADGIPFVKER